MFFTFSKSVVQGWTVLTQTCAGPLNPAPLDLNIWEANLSRGPQRDKAGSEPPSLFHKLAHISLTDGSTHCTFTVFNHYLFLPPLPLPLFFRLCI
uniref:Uncharacterized protein n=1 Tax=Gouania willdenowi TaxID=441366 RepID=A0A8C5HF41_GOUWI